MAFVFLKSAMVLDIMFCGSFSANAFLPTLIVGFDYQCTERMRIARFVFNVIINLTLPLIYQLIFVGVVDMMTKIQNERTEEEECEYYNRSEASNTFKSATTFQSCINDEPRETSEFPALYEMNLNR